MGVNSSLPDAHELPYKPPTKVESFDDAVALALRQHRESDRTVKTPQIDGVNRHNRRRAMRAAKNIDARMRRAQRNMERRLLRQFEAAQAELDALEEEE